MQTTRDDINAMQVSCKTNCRNRTSKLRVGKQRTYPLSYYFHYSDKGRKRKADKPKTESEEIHDIIGSEVAKCCCVHKFNMTKVAEGKYRFGDQQKLRLVRILRSQVMVRVGGGWSSLLEFLEKNDPCRGKHNSTLILHDFVFS